MPAVERAQRNLWCKLGLSNDEMKPIEEVLRSFITTFSGPLTEFIVAVMTALFNLEDDDDDAVHEALLQYAGEAATDLQQEARRLRTCSRRSYQMRDYAHAMLHRDPTSLMYHVSSQLRTTALSQRTPTALLASTFGLLVRGFDSALLAMTFRANYMRHRFRPAGYDLRACLLRSLRSQRRYVGDHP
ncbi:hypothetical protein PVAP13_8KG017021 [Panicum virgatum]|uniref:Uncharacterized protein n=1 Tax=Panicum virgatum TaxID=38727 RepID=A0A8T0PC24_PANVG|nr:hypothetical protein PVAP13_8KG017021 [Panicum virgatum]